MANGSNEVLQTLSLAYGGPGRSVAVFEPTYALHAHIARITGTSVAEGERAADFSLDLAEVRRVVAEADPGHHLPVLAQQPDGDGRDAGGRRRGAGPRPGTGGRRRGLRPVRALVGADARRRRHAAGRHPHLLQDVVDGRGPARLPRRTPVGRRRAREGRAAVPPRCGEAGRRHRGPRLRRRHGGPGLAPGRGARSPGGGAARPAPATCGRRGPTSSCSAPAPSPATTSGPPCSTTPSSSATARRWPRLDGCLRVTVGTTDEDDRFLTALREILT